jgi:hypothetical protein
MVKKTAIIATDDAKSAGKSMIRVCTCVNAFQDATYGRGMRVHNIGKGKVHCTVCSTEKMK